MTYQHSASVIAAGILYSSKQIKTGWRPQANISFFIVNFGVRHPTFEGVCIEFIFMVEKKIEQ